MLPMSDESRTVEPSRSTPANIDERLIKKPRGSVQLITIKKSAYSIHCSSELAGTRCRDRLHAQDLRMIP